MFDVSCRREKRLPCRLRLLPFLVPLQWVYNTKLTSIVKQDFFRVKPLDKVTFTLGHSHLWGGNSFHFLLFLPFPRNKKVCPFPCLEESGPKSRKINLDPFPKPFCCMPVTYTGYVRRTLHSYYCTWLDLFFFTLVNRWVDTPAMRNENPPFLPFFLSWEPTDVMSAHNRTYYARTQLKVVLWLQQNWS